MSVADLAIAAAFVAALLSSRMSPNRAGNGRTLFAGRAQVSAKEADLDAEQFAADLALALAAGCRPVEALSRCSRHRRGAVALRGQLAVERISLGLDPLSAFGEGRDASESQEEASLYVALAGELKSGLAAAPAVAAIARAAAHRARVRESERSARAAPLVQLIVALGLVPSALLLGAGVVVAGLGNAS
jgi:Flp pilus assembly protein TadB